MKSIVGLLCLTLLLSAGKNETLLQVVKNTPLLHTGAHIVSLKGETYLIGSGTASIENNSSRAKVMAIKVSQVNAQRALTLFIHSSALRVDEVLKKVKIVESNAQKEKAFKKKTAISKQFIRTVEEKSDGILVNLEPLGKWVEKGHYYFVYVLRIPDA